MNNFSTKLTDWYHNNKRDLPWRNTRDPFKIWLSEIILQQTRVDQGLSYYHKFIDRFSSVKDLAKASEDEVLSLWQGLGYYSRGRNLRKAAIQVMEEFDGVFPKDSINLKKLKGVGDYSSAAISSFSNDEKIAVVDGNVFRVLSRIFNINTPIDTGQGKKEFNALANALISSIDPASHNQAIMEYGATVCTPKKPLCNNCIFSDQCEAFNNDLVYSLPVKSKKIKKTTRHFHFEFILKENKMLLQKRDEKGIWANMYQLPLTETTSDQSPFSEKIKLNWQCKHVLSHQNLFCKFYTSDDYNSHEGIWVELNQVEKYAIPKVIDNFLSQYFQ